MHVWLFVFLLSAPVFSSQTYLGYVGVELSSKVAPSRTIQCELCHGRRCKSGCHSVVEDQSRVRKEINVRDLNGGVDDQGPNSWDRYMLFLAGSYYEGHSSIDQRESVAHEAVNNRTTRSQTYKKPMAFALISSKLR